jgi:hypothetical protein
MPAGGKLYLSLFDDKWAPTGNVGRHFNSTSRFGLKGEDANWRAFFAHQWRSKNSLYNPVYFDGVRTTDERDANGDPIYYFTPSTLFTNRSHHANAHACPPSTCVRPPISSASVARCASSATTAPPPTL